ncbi:hypothetical protein N6B72_05175 [Chryseobacterium soli]|uniref:hypothetical protein n=1 Tax=Chryseobacterium soli TaxID=445961 RepID=UPI002952C9BA|nr:hypothetical protein [Chryseobacterium soli]MDV7696307.1 hypothetical protein [Chryseobacterium soli]
MILYFIAYFLLLPLTFVNYLVVLFNSKDHARGYFKSSAINIDKFGNREFRTLWNATLRTDAGYQFGNINETISSVLGKNERDETLTKTGKILVFFLNTIDKNHCRKSINNLIN